ncbi:DNA adenine methylase [Brevibacillus sp. 179-C 9.1 HS]
MHQYSPLRYPGGKSKLTKYIKKMIETNNLLDGIYVEPYAGGAGVAICLLMQEYVSSICINDINKSIYAFWHAVLHQTDDLCQLIHDTEVTVENWDIQKEVQKNTDNYSMLELGFSTFFLNRSNRSGIIKGGIIGGRNQDGKWKIDARYNKKNLIDRIEKISLYGNRIKLYNLDASDFISTVIPSFPEKTFIYLDPPYFNKGQDLYENHYKPEDHSNVYEQVSTKLKHKWIITYDNVQEIKDLYGKYRQQVYSLSYSAANRYQGKEVMIYSDNIIIPEENIYKN